MIALVIGATGATGEPLVHTLLQNNAIEKVVIFVRKPLQWQHEKLTIHIVDFDNLQAWKDLIKGDMAFSVLGTTLKDAGSKEAQYKVDYTYQYEFAKAAKENDIAQFILLSAMGADANSAIFYSRIKGELENSVQALHFDKLSIFKPGALIRPNSTRKGERFGVKFIQFLNTLGIGKRYKPLATKDLAIAMMHQAFEQKNALEIVGFKDILKYV